APPPGGRPAAVGRSDEVRGPVRAVLALRVRGVDRGHRARRAPVHGHREAPRGRAGGRVGEVTATWGPVRRLAPAPSSSRCSDGICPRAGRSLSMVGNPIQSGRESWLHDTAATYRPAEGRKVLTPGSMELTWSPRYSRTARRSRSS